MALANRRPLAIPVSENTNSSPSYKPRRLSLEKDFKSKEYKSKNIAKHIKELTPEKSSSSSPQEFDMEASPTSTTASSVSSQSFSKPTKEPKVKGEKKEKKEKKEPRVPIATGISTTIPVTGERPKPEEDNSLDDSVLYAIFLILYEHDPEGKGMTVKQICDILIEKHPEMANLSSKTSNLVSAKLNAYVKRVEKGEKSLIYALSREWADASPKRMVYVYRGLLTHDYYLHALAAIESQKANGEPPSNDNEDVGSTKRSLVSAEEKKKFFDNLNNDENSSSGPEIRRRATTFDLGVNKHNFADSLQLDLSLPQLTVPYSSAPVTACLGLGSSLKKSTAAISSLSKDSPAIADYELEDYDHFDEDEEDDDFGSTIKVTYRNNKRSKSMSYLSSKKGRTLTIAAAAPRFSKESLTPSPSTAAAVAALHAAALEGLSPAGSVASGFEDSSRHSMSSEPPVAAKWLKAVRDGFLTQDIDAPEDISLAELDSLFT